MNTYSLNRRNHPFLRSPGAALAAMIAVALMHPCAPAHAAARPPARKAAPTPTPTATPTPAPTLPPAVAPAVVLSARLVSATGRDATRGAENLLDGDAKTEFVFAWPNGGAEILLDLGAPAVVTGLRITAGPSGGPNYLGEVSVGGRRQNLELIKKGYKEGEQNLAHHAEQGRVWGKNPDGHLRPLLERKVNLVVSPGGVTEIGLPPSVARLVRVSVSGGGGEVGIAGIEVLGRPDHRLERHLLHWWAGNSKEDFVGAADYLADDLGATDVWIDKIASVFTNSRPDFGFASVAESGSLDALRAKGIRYWLVEGEGFPGLVNAPEDLRNDRLWQTTMTRAREIFTGAKKLGFAGYVMDAEDYALPSAEVTEAAKKKYGFDHIDAWCFKDEFGPDGMYYRRGREFGRVMREVWGPDAVLIQYYIPQVYHDYRKGNYWWLLGIHEEGVEIRLGDEQTYGAGKGELYDPAKGYPDWTTRWFVNFPEKSRQVHELLPFVSKVYPGLHPWVTSHGAIPLFLPKYLDDQLDISGDYFDGVWIYNSGTPHAGDPRKVLDPEVMKKLQETHGVTAEDYLKVFRKNPTTRTPAQPAAAEPAAGKDN